MLIIERWGGLSALRRHALFTWGDAPGWHGAAPLALGAPAARMASGWMFSFAYGSMMLLTKKIKVSWLMVVAVAGGLLLFFATRSDEPTHGGRRLSYWIRKHYYSDDNGRLEAQGAILAMGTNAVPHLIRMLPERDTAWKITYDSKVIKLFDYNWSKAQMFLLGSRSRFAARALGTIGHPAREAIPYLIENMTNSPLSSSSPSDYVLALLEIGADSVLPLANALSHPNPDLRSHAAWALGHSDTNLSHGDTRIANALMQCLKDNAEERPLPGCQQPGQPWRGSQGSSARTDRKPQQQGHKFSGCGPAGNYRNRHEPSGRRIPSSPEGGERVVLV